MNLRGGDMPDKCWLDRLVSSGFTPLSGVLDVDNAVALCEEISDSLYEDRDYTSIPDDEPTVHPVRNADNQQEFIVVANRLSPGDDAYFASWDGYLLT